MYQPSPALYHHHSSNYHPTFSSTTSSPQDTLLSVSPTYLPNSIENSRGDLGKFSYLNNTEADSNIDQLSLDEKILLQKAEQEEKQYHREIQMTTLINSRY